MLDENKTFCFLKLTLDELNFNKFNPINRMPQIETDRNQFPESSESKMISDLHLCDCRSKIQRQSRNWNELRPWIALQNKLYDRGRNKRRKKPTCFTLHKFSLCVKTAQTICWSTLLHKKRTHQNDHEFYHHDIFAVEHRKEERKDIENLKKFERILIFIGWRT